ncbi:MAG: sugar-transfer associated ATP-grasp domain-containing protein [Pseudomonadota bacterium]
MKQTSVDPPKAPVGRSVDWLLRRALVLKWQIGPQNMRARQTRKSDVLLPILTANTVICQEMPHLRSRHRRAFEFVRTCLRAFTAAYRVMRLYGRQAKKTYGRSYLLQFYDITRIWWYADLPPLEYYKAFMAQYRGGDEMFHFMDWHVIFRVVAHIQRDLHGDLPAPYNDKGAFGAWLRANDLPGPKEIVVRGAHDQPSADKLAGLGDGIVIKPCFSGYGDGFEVFEKSGAGHWSAKDKSLTHADLADHVKSRAAAVRGGVVVQERLTNSADLEAMCGKALATCRFVTMRNEYGEPELVEHFWRMGWPGSLVDNYNAGGLLWMADDMETGRLAFGLSVETAAQQRPLTHHPITGDNMVASRHPDFDTMRELALKAHRRMAGVFLAGWDVASTAKGPMLVEVNIPCQTAPSAQLTTDGFSRWRYGQLLAYHAEKWLAARG